MNKPYSNRTYKFIMILLLFIVISSNVIFPILILTNTIYISKKVESLVDNTPYISVGQAVTKELTREETIDNYIVDICNSYNNIIPPEIVKSIVWHESTYNPNAINDDGSCVGLMQVSTHWHSKRAEKLGVTNFYDIEGNLKLGIDYLVELNKQYKDIRLVLMLYNMKHETAFELYNKGQISEYAKSVLDRAESLK